MAGVASLQEVKFLSELERNENIETGKILAKYCTMNDYRAIHFKEGERTTSVQLQILSVSSFVNYKFNLTSSPAPILMKRQGECKKEGHDLLVSCLAMIFKKKCFC